MTDIIEVLKPDSITVTENLPDVLEVSSSDFGSVDVTDVTFVDIEAGTATVVEIYNGGDDANLANPNNPFQNIDQPHKPLGLVYSLFGINGLKISWNPATYFNHKHTNIYSSATNSFITATLIGSSTSTVFNTTAPTGAPIVYWVEFVSLAGIIGPVSDALTATVPGSAAELLALLQQQVDESALTNTLATRIDKIETTEDAIAAETNNRSIALAAEILNRDTAIGTAISTEVTDRDVAISTAIAFSEGATYGAIANETSVRQTNEGILAQQTALIQTALEPAVSWIRDGFFNGKVVGDAGSPWPTHTQVAYNYSGELAASAAVITANNTAIDLPLPDFFVRKQGDTIYVRVRVKAGATFDGTLSLVVDEYDSTQASLATSNGFLVPAASYTPRDLWYWIEGSFTTTHISCAYVKARVSVTGTTGIITLSNVYYADRPYGGSVASVETQASSLNGLSAQYTVKLDVNGRVAGYGLASTAAVGDKATFSEFTVLADRFAILHPNATDPTNPQLAFTVANGKTVMDAASVVNLGAQAITMNTTGHIKGGRSLYAEGTGYYLGYDVDKYKFIIGYSPTAAELAPTQAELDAGAVPAIPNSLEWNGTDLIMQGGTIQGTHIAADSLLSYGEPIPVTGDTVPERYPFSVSSEGLIIADADGVPTLRLDGNGLFGGWNGAGWNSQILADGNAIFNNATLNGFLVADAISGIITPVPPTNLNMGNNLAGTSIVHDGWMGVGTVYKYVTNAFPFNSFAATSSYDVDPSNGVASAATNWSFESEQIVINYLAIADAADYLKIKMPSVTFYGHKDDDNSVFDTTHMYLGYRIYYRKNPRTAPGEDSGTGVWTAWTVFSGGSSGPHHYYSRTSSQSKTITLPATLQVLLNGAADYGVKIKVEVSVHWGRDGGGANWNGKQITWEI